MSISKQQAAALAEGFFDNIGSSKEGFQPRNTLSEVILLAGELVELAQENLNRSNRHSSGRLSESLIVDEPTRSGNTVRMDVLMNFYGAFVNKGVKGLKSGTSLAGYSFRYAGVSQNMAAAISDWMSLAKISTRSVKKYSGYGKHEVKNKSISQLDSAYAVARSIKQKGLKPTGFMDNAIAATRSKIASRLGAALRIDIIDGLRS